MASKINLLQIGALNNQKGQEVSIRAIKQLLDSNYEATLTIIGEGPDNNKLKDLTKKLGVEDVVVFKGFLKHTEVGRYYKKCDLVLCPGTNETFSAVPIEALKYGKPSIIATDSGVMEVLEHFAVFTAPDTEHFYKEIVKFCKSKTFLNNKAKKGKDWVKKNLSWDKYATDFVELIKDEVPATVYNEDYFKVHHESPRSDFLFKERQTRMKRGVDLLNIKKGQKILDLGSGNGEVAEIMTKKGAKVWGIDYSIDAVRLSKARKLTGSQFTVGRIGNLPYKDNFFDGVISLDVFEHVYPEELNRAVTEVQRVIKPGGKLVVATAPNSFYLKPAELAAKLFMGVNSFESDKYHINVFDYFRFKRIFDNIKADKNIFLTNDSRYYFYSRIFKNKKIPRFIKTAAKFVDYITENPLSEKIIFATPLKIFFGHELWAVIKFNK